ncbi:unnamed protein product, partial [marine sediment metagenome]
MTDTELRKRIRQIADEADAKNGRNRGNWGHFKDLLADQILKALKEPTIIEGKTYHRK